MNSIKIEVHQIYIVHDSVYMITATLAISSRSVQKIAEIVAWEISKKAEVEAEQKKKEVSKELHRCTMELLQHDILD